MTNETVDYLIGLNKKITQDGDVLDNVTIEQKFPMQIRFKLVSEDDDDFSFLWEINQSEKNALRISLHFQENDSNIGLFRVDYNSGHHNPENANDGLPDKFKPYIGKWFVNESHVHYYVNGYKPLAWAIPIDDSEMNIKSIDGANSNQLFVDAIIDFAKIINVETIIKVNSLLL